MLTVSVVDSTFYRLLIFELLQVSMKMFLNNSNIDVIAIDFQ